MNKIALLTAAGIGCGTICVCRISLAETLTDEQVRLLTHMTKSKISNAAEDVQRAIAGDEQDERDDVMATVVGEGGIGALMLVSALGGRPGRRNNSGEDRDSERGGRQRRTAPAGGE